MVEIPYKNINLDNVIFKHHDILLCINVFSVICDCVNLVHDYLVSVILEKIYKNVSRSSLQRVENQDFKIYKFSSFKCYYRDTSLRARV